VNIQNLPLDQIIFFDIETVPCESDFDMLSPALQDLWITKSSRIKPDEYLSPEDKFKTYAGIFAEFGRIVCISMGLIHQNEGMPNIRMKSFFGDDEVQLLMDFSSLINTHLDNKKYSYLCGHNIREFDIPYICRRMLINQIPMPSKLYIAGKKPWELEHFMDTLNLWKFGDYKNYTSLKLLMELFGLPSPKEDIDGSQVGNVYWQEKNIERIVRYCERDVLAVMRLCAHWSGVDLPDDKNVTFSLQ
jgi:hypothetical protein